VGGKRGNHGFVETTKWEYPQGGNPNNPPWGEKRKGFGRGSGSPEVQKNRKMNRRVRETETQDSFLMRRTGGKKKFSRFRRGGTQKRTPQGQIETLRACVCPFFKLAAN